MAQLVKNPPAMQDTWVRPLGWEDSLEEGMATHSSILTWRIPMDRGAWRAAVHGVTKSDRTKRLSTLIKEGFPCARTVHVGRVLNRRVLSLLSWSSFLFGDAENKQNKLVNNLKNEYIKWCVMKKEMATHSSVLAWRIPGTGEPGGLLSMGSHRVGHD